MTKSKPTYAEMEKRVRELEAEPTGPKPSVSSTAYSWQQVESFLEFLPYPVLIRDMSEKIIYLNPAFTRTFLWTLNDLRGTPGHQYVPVYLRSQLSLKIKSMIRNDSPVRMTSRRLTKDGRKLKVALRIGIQKDENNNPLAIITVLRDVTREDRIDRNREAMTRISMALPQYPELRDLLSYIIGEIKSLLHVQAANVLLPDESRNEIYFFSSGHDDPGQREKIEKLRFSLDDMLSGQVVKTGKPVMINESSMDADRYRDRDEKLGYQVKNILLVPLRVQDRVIGVLGADNKKEGPFDQTDMETMSTIAGTVALSIENARVTGELKKAYEELKGLNQAKDKMINHLSHEIKTPVAILMSSFAVLSRRLKDLPEETWKPTMERVKRNLERIIDIQYEVDDIIEKNNPIPQKMFSMILDQCQDELASLIAEHTGEGKVIEKVKEKISDIFWPRHLEVKTIDLDRFVRSRLETLAPKFSYRDLEIRCDLNPAPPVRIPEDPLGKTIDGLIRNAVENTPDQGRIDISVAPREGKTRFTITDYGTGITPGARKHILDGFITTRETADYSSKRPFDFHAGGKGADLLRMKIFSERYGFTIHLDSKRCRHIPTDRDICPGSKEKCRQLSMPNWPGCDGTTSVILEFPS